MACSNAIHDRDIDLREELLIPRSQVRFLPGALVEGYFSLKPPMKLAQHPPPAAAHGHSYGYVHDALTETDTQLRGLGAEQPRM
ncbi:helix-turn-helix domain-containing protein [Mycobacteroides abscessus]